MLVSLGCRHAGIQRYIMSMYHVVNYRSSGYNSDDDEMISMTELMMMMMTMILEVVVKMMT